MPTFENEIVFWKRGSHVVGIDEVGKGALAGPLTLSAVFFAHHLSPGSFLSLIKSGINDSKLISAVKRERLNNLMKDLACTRFTVSAPPSHIDKKGIMHAWRHCFSQLIAQIRISVPHDSITVLVDGLPIHDLRYDKNTVIQFITKGDRASVAIASASITAKVSRDSYMTNLSPRYPLYHFHRNKGYGTKEHISALHTSGPTAQHRLSFIDHIISPSHIA